MWAGGHHLTVDADGFLARAGLAETLEASQDVQGKVTALSQKIKKTVPFGGVALWDHISDSEGSEVD